MLTSGFSTDILDTREASERLLAATKLHGAIILRRFYDRSLDNCRVALLYFFGHDV